MTTEPEPTDEAYQAAEKSGLLVQKIRPLLAGKGPNVQGGALLELVATWLAGHHPDLRDEVWRSWCESLLEMMPLCEAEILSHYPKGWNR